MARPEKLRRIGGLGGQRGFKPVGRRVVDLEVETLRLDGLEALRLADVEGLYQRAAAARMGVSRPTYARILQRARSAVARALLEERLLVIGGAAPVVRAPDESFPCPVHGTGRRMGRDCRCRRRWQKRRETRDNETR